MSDTETPDQSDAPPLLSCANELSIREIFMAAGVRPQQRLAIVEACKMAFINRQEFDKAARCRDAEKGFKDKWDSEIQRWGADFWDTYEGKETWDVNRMKEMVEELREHLQAQPEAG